jgi:cytidylate kinase
VLIAIDGPAGSGKSSVSRRVARRIGWRHLDTGAFYRAATLAVLEDGADPDSEEEVVRAVTGRRFDQTDGQMYLDGIDVSDHIRSAEVTEAVSAVSAHPRLRSLMVEQQRQWVADNGGDAVVEGRDIGTVVFPAAEVKIWLAASAAERARRRATETGEDPAVVEVEILRRDRADSGRAVSPLRPASDAIHLDTTNLDIDEVVDRIVALASVSGKSDRTTDRYPSSDG